MSGDVHLDDVRLAQFTATGLIVAEGECRIDQMACTGCPAAGTIPPEVWRKLSDPCDTCGGTGERWSYPGSGPPTYRGPCADCVGGRPTVTLTATCGRCDGYRYTRQGAHNYLNTCERCDGEGVVTLGRFTIRLLPIVEAPDWPTGAYVQRFSNGDVFVVSADRSETTLLTITPLPQPGQWVVQFEPAS